MGRFNTKVKKFAMILIVVSFNICLSFKVFAAPLYFEPITKALPDGSTIALFMSGDEFFNYLHDTNSFPVGIGSDGYYYYLIQDNDNFLMTSFRAGASDPFKIKGIKPVSIPSYVEAKRNAYQKQMDEGSEKRGVKGYNKSAGIFNNLVMYIRFLNEPEFTTQRSVYETRLNSLTTSSLRGYYKEVSYSKLDLVSYSFPGGSTSNIYYTDIYARSYYQPYNASTNLDGYKSDSERTSREHTLLANAIIWATSNYAIPAGVNFDMNQDGVFDNICFVVRGNSDAWNDLLWPHRWALYTLSVKIGSLKVYGYTLQLENVSVNTLSHEMFHALGAPDLYHYNNTEKPVGPWDIMATGSCHPGAWMKYKYGGWIDSVNEIRKSGTYHIKPLLQDKNIIYLVRSPYLEDQFFVLEYRKKSGSYEINIPSSGLIIQRIDIRYRGNSTGPPDEVYVFRKDGGPGIAGDINSAAFSNLNGRTSFTDYTNPNSFFQDGSKTGININNIISMGDSMSFSVDIDQPVEFTLTQVEDTKMSGSWKSVGNKEFIVAVATSGIPVNPRQGISYLPGDTIGTNGLIIQKSTAKYFQQTDLISDEPYYYTVWAVVNNNPPAYSAPLAASKRTGIYSVGNLPHEETFDNITSELPRGWKSVSGNSGWQISNDSPSSSQNSILLLNPNRNPDEWFYTPGFELSSYYKYMITFRYRNKSPDIRESLFLQGGVDRSNSGLTLFNLFSSIDFSLKEYGLFKSVFMPGSTGTYYFGFKTGTTGQGVLIDDFRIEKVPNHTKQHLKPEEFYPNPTSGKITVPATENTIISVLRADGKNLFETQIESMQEIDLSALGKGIFLIRFTGKDKTVTRKIIIL
jgi:M6 family metalloprotease-like protein